MSISSDVQEFINTSLAQNNAALLGQISKLVADSAENLKRSSVEAANEQLDTLEEAKSNLEVNARTQLRRLKRYSEKVRRCFPIGKRLPCWQINRSLVGRPSRNIPSINLLTARRTARRFAKPKKELRRHWTLLLPKSQLSVLFRLVVLRPCSVVHRTLVVSLRWVPGETKMSSRHSLLLPFRQKMAIVLPVVSLATGDRNAPNFSVQDIKVICRVTNDCMMVEKVCLTILLIFPSVISPKFVPKYLYSKVRTLSLKV